MTNTFDQHGINHMIVALGHEMTPKDASRHHDFDTLFFGGPTPTELDQGALAAFGLRTNYKLIYATFDVANPGAGPVAFHAFINDGLTESITLQGARIWKRDRRTPTVLVLAEDRIVIKISAKRRITVREMKGEFHSQGFDLAIEALKQRASWKPGGIPVFSTIGMLPVVMDVRAMSEALAQAA